MIMILDVCCFRKNSLSARVAFLQNATCVPLSWFLLVTLLLAMPFKINVAPMTAVAEKMTKFLGPNRFYSEM